MFILGMFFGFLIAVVVFIVSITYAKEIQTVFKTTSNSIKPLEKAELIPRTRPTAEFLESLINDDSQRS